MKLKYILLLLLNLFLLSCNEYLDKVPNSKYNIELDNISKIRETITSAYPNISYFAFLEARTDNVAKREGAVYKNRLNEAMYFWGDYNSDDPDTPLSYWNECYKGIAEVNHALENLKRFPEKPLEIKALYGEALVLRAYLHFMLVNIWAEPYNPLTADKDLGIPYLLKPEKNAIPTYDRSTVENTYNLIKEDLEIGLGLIDDRFYKQSKYHFNKKAAYAFATRFYLYTGNWDKVIFFSDHVLGIDAASVLKDWKKLGDYRYIDRDATVYDLYEVENPSNLLVVPTESRWNKNYKNEEYGLDINKSIELFGNFSPPHLNVNFYYASKVSGLKSTTSKFIDKFKDFSTYQSLENNYRGIYMDNILFTTDEVLLNKIEALAMKGDYNKAILELRTYAKAKTFYPFTETEIKYSFKDAQNNYISSFEPMAFFKASLIAFVCELRRREFVHEGLRWFDIRRYHLSINRNSEGEELDLNKFLKKNDKRKVLQIPNDAILSGLTPNPR